jgi:hypothetical protein
VVCANRNLAAEPLDKKLKWILGSIITTAVLASFPVTGEPLSPINPARMSATVKTLASDTFEGRAPGTPGEAKTVAYLVGRFRALGLRPDGENGGWLQQVPLVHNIADTSAGPVGRPGLKALSSRLSLSFNYCIASDEATCLFPRSVA